jgi:hypothetical protein
LYKLVIGFQRNHAGDIKPIALRDLPGSIEDFGLFNSDLGTVNDSRTASSKRSNGAGRLAVIILRAVMFRVNGRSQHENLSTSSISH